MRPAYRNLWLSLMAVCCLAAFSNEVLAKCTDADWTNGSSLVNYAGTIDEKYSIQMTLVISGENVTGVYFYQSQLKDIHIKGNLADASSLVLDELDPTGKVVAKFNAKFVEQDPKGRFGGNDLRCEIIVGTWSKDGKQGLSVYLAEESITIGTLDHRYEPAGVDNDALIDSNALRFWAAIKNNDKPAVAAQINYPINVSVSGHLKKINGVNDLLSNYDAIFTARFREAILKAAPKNMFVNAQGIMLGNGEVWFGQNGKVITLNN